MRVQDCVERHDGNEVDQERDELVYHVESSKELPLRVHYCLDTLDLEDR